MNVLTPKLIDAYNDFNAASTADEKLAAKKRLIETSIYLHWMTYDDLASIPDGLDDTVAAVLKFVADKLSGPGLFPD